MLKSRRQFIYTYISLSLSVCVCVFLQKETFKPMDLNEMISKDL